MKSKDTDTSEPGEPNGPAWDSVLRAEVELLNRARDVSQQIVERVNRLLEDTAQHTALPTEPTKEHPPLQE
jgi:hypothetical protein